ncbi:MAG: hypothetical protein WC285_05200 [Candidatus Gracilibacteria bacterium]|jgi:hypothetical protein
MYPAPHKDFSKEAIDESVDSYVREYPGASYDVGNALANKDPRKPDLIQAGVTRLLDMDSDATDTLTLERHAHEIVNGHLDLATEGGPQRIVDLFFSNRNFRDTVVRSSTTFRRFCEEVLPALGKTDPTVADRVFEEVLKLATTEDRDSHRNEAIISPQIAEWLASQKPKAVRDHLEQTERKALLAFTHQHVEYRDDHAHTLEVGGGLTSPGELMPREERIIRATACKTVSAFFAELEKLQAELASDQTTDLSRDWSVLEAAERCENLFRKLLRNSSKVYENMEEGATREEDNQEVFNDLSQAVTQLYKDLGKNANQALTALNEIRNTLNASAPGPQYAMLGAITHSGPRESRSQGHFMSQEYLFKGISFFARALVQRYEDPEYKDPLNNAIGILAKMNDSRPLKNLGLDAAKKGAHNFAKAIAVLLSSDQQDYLRTSDILIALRENEEAEKILEKGLESFEEDKLAALDQQARREYQEKHQEYVVRLALINPERAKHHYDKNATKDEKYKAEWSGEYEATYACRTAQTDRKTAVKLMNKLLSRHQHAYAAEIAKTLQDFKTVKDIMDWCLYVDPHDGLGYSTSRAYGHEGTMLEREGRSETAEISNTIVGTNLAVWLAINAPEQKDQILERLGEAFRYLRNHGSPRSPLYGQLLSVIAAIEKVYATNLTDPTTTSPDSTPTPS